MTSTEKRKYLQFLLDGGSSAHVYFDARMSGLVIPRHLRGQKRVLFKIGRCLIPKIPDLELTEVGVEATLAFDSVSYWCQVPWEAITDMYADKRRKSKGWRLPSGKLMPSYLRVVK